MTKTIIRISIFMLVFGNGCVFAEKKLLEDNQTKYQQVIILDKGVKRTISIQTDGTGKSGYSTKQLVSQNGILVSFKNISDLSISDFEKKYGLKLKEKMIIGYYLFENVSKYSDVVIIQNIIDNESNIKSVKPNWRMRNTPR